MSLVLAIAIFFFSKYRSDILISAQAVNKTKEAEDLYNSGMDLYAKLDIAESLKYLQLSCEKSEYRIAHYALNYAFVLAAADRLSTAISAVRAGMTSNEEQREVELRRETAETASRNSTELRNLKNDYVIYCDHMRMYLVQVSSKLLILLLLLLSSLS